MATFTTFAFGTGENSTMEKKNLISQFSEACASAHGVIQGPDILGFKVTSNANTHTEQIINWLQTQNQPQSTWSSPNVAVKIHHSPLHQIF